MVASGAARSAAAGAAVTRARRASNEGGFGGIGMAALGRKSGYKTVVLTTGGPWYTSAAQRVMARPILMAARRSLGQDSTAARPNSAPAATNGMPAVAATPPAWHVRSSTSRDANNYLDVGKYSAIASRIGASDTSNGEWRAWVIGHNVGWRRTVGRWCLTTIRRARPYGQAVAVTPATFPVTERAFASRAAAGYWTVTTGFAC